jgi:pimeloyl-ACP methyl ester carboxylesterase
VDLIPGAGQQVRIEGAAHFLQEDAGEEIARLMLAWLEKQPQGGEF